MAITIAECLLFLGTAVANKAFDRQMDKALDYFEKRKLASKIDEIVIAVMEPMSVFFSAEGMSTEDVERVGSSAKGLVEWLIENPNFAAARGLITEKIVNDLLQTEAGLECIANTQPHSAALDTLLRALVDLAVSVPPVLKNWEKTSFQTIFSQTEDIKATLGSVYSLMQKVVSTQSKSDDVFDIVRNHCAASIALKTSIHGLRQSAVPQAELDKLFVFPAFDESIIKQSKLLLEDKCNEMDLSMEREVKGIDIIKYNDFDSFKRQLFSGNSFTIVAPAGAGKSTFSAWINSKLLSSTDTFLPIVMPLRQINRKGDFPTLTDSILSVISPAFKDRVSTQKVGMWASEGKIILILDGFDEISESKREKYLEWITALPQAHPGLMVIVTSRPLSTDHLDRLNGFENWRSMKLLAFDQSRVVQYISNFQEYGPAIMTGAKKQRPEELAAQWLSDTTLAPLTGNPLLLSTLLIVHHMDGELPDDRSKLYERYIDGMLGLWEINKELDEPKVALTKEQKKKVLELIAVNMISLEIDAADEEEVFDWVSNYISDQAIASDARAVLDHLRERSGLLIGPGQYTFAHKSIGEFLVAQACNDGIQIAVNGTRMDRFTLDQHCLSDRWNTVVFLWAGIAAKLDVQNFIENRRSLGDIAVAGGLLLERRRFLERNWVCSEFWRILNAGIKPGGELHNDTSDINIVYNSGPGSSHIPRELTPVFRLKSVGSLFSDILDFVDIMYRENYARPGDWKNLEGELSIVLWCGLCTFEYLSDGFIESAPKILTDPMKFLIIAKAYKRDCPEEIIDNGFPEHPYKSQIDPYLMIARLMDLVFYFVYASDNKDLYFDPAPSPNAPKTKEILSDSTFLHLLLDKPSGVFGRHGDTAKVNTFYEECFNAVKECKIPEQKQWVEFLNECNQQLAALKATEVAIV
ncbi:NACHT domain-containing protein [Ochrobactrum sp. Q0168]|uniref:NACHT domain-containing protein n=1 Tax=Ochrobactrum sp. Q0168 TaxID=2793241 RepID=UPI0018EB9DAA|nr:NACHT domain-containing protein [Ochrobactrum sp. Q0168]